MGQRHWMNLSELLWSQHCTFMKGLWEIPDSKNFQEVRSTNRRFIWMCKIILFLPTSHFYLPCSHQSPTSNESIPEEARHKVQPNVIPLYCTNKVHMCFPSFLLGLWLFYPCIILRFSLHTSRKRRMLVKSGRLSTMVLVVVSPCSITHTMANFCTFITCSLWWHCSSPTWQWTPNCASNAKYLGTTYIIMRRTATRDALTSRFRSTVHDHHQNSSTFPDFPSLYVPWWWSGWVVRM